MTNQQLRNHLEKDLFAFIKWVSPKLYLGAIHEHLINLWMTRDPSKNQLDLLPRGHLKSNLMAHRVAWEITKQPWITFIYLTETDKLAKSQLNFIQNILTCERYRKLWPEMVNKNKFDREQWNQDSFKVDHPLRKEYLVRDPTVEAYGMGTSNTGFHCERLVTDDIVTPKNAYTELGRSTVSNTYSFFASVKNPDAPTWGIGTLYDPKDLYHKWMEQKVSVYADNGELLREEPLFEYYKVEVEDAGDGSGHFIWPRSKAPNGQMYGFDRNILERKKAEYLSGGEEGGLSAFYSQYYLTTDIAGNEVITSDQFRYYQAEDIDRGPGCWTYLGKEMKVLVGMDFSWSDSKSADWTAIAVCGVTSDPEWIILDLDRFKVKPYNRIEQYYQHLYAIWDKWQIPARPLRVRAEAVAAQRVIVDELRRKCAEEGVTIKMIDHNPGNKASKSERIEAYLGPKYESRLVRHRRGGLWTALEEELRLSNPAHDDLKDAVSIAFSGLTKPAKSGMIYGQSITNNPKVITHPRFGGLQ